MTDYNIQLRVRNGRFLRTLRAKGHTQASLSRASGVNANTISHFMNLRRPPILTDGSVSPSVFKICEVLNVGLDELFPDQHLETPLRKNNAEIDATFEDIQGLVLSDNGAFADSLEASIDRRALLERALTALKPRERRVIEKRLAGKTLEEIAEDEPRLSYNYTWSDAPHIGRQMALHLENRAVRKMRKALTDMKKKDKDK